MPRKTWWFPWHADPANLHQQQEIRGPLLHHRSKLRCIHGPSGPCLRREGTSRPQTARCQADTVRLDKYSQILCRAGSQQAPTCARSRFTFEVEPHAAHCHCTKATSDEVRRLCDPQHSRPREHRSSRKLQRNAQASLKCAQCRPPLCQRIASRSSAHSSRSARITRGGGGREVSVNLATKVGSMAQCFSWRSEICGLSSMGKPLQSLRFERAPAPAKLDAAATTPRAKPAPHSAQDTTRPTWRLDRDATAPTGRPLPPSVWEGAPQDLDSLALRHVELPSPELIRSRRLSEAGAHDEGIRRSPLSNRASDKHQTSETKSPMDPASLQRPFQILLTRKKEVGSCTEGAQRLEGLTQRPEPGRQAA